MNFRLEMLISYLMIDLTLMGAHPKGTLYRKHYIKIVAISLIL